MFCEGKALGVFCFCKDVGKAFKIAHVRIKTGKHKTFTGGANMNL